MLRFVSTSVKLSRGSLATRGNSGMQVLDVRRTISGSKKQFRSEDVTKEIDKLLINEIQQIKKADEV